jgi:uncharacterized membrane protein YbhN (UPF0104 family)
MARRRRGTGDTDLLHVDRRKAAQAIGVATLLGIGAVGVIGTVTDYGKMLDAVREAEPAWFAVAVLGQVCAYTGYIVAYRSISRARGGPCLDYWTAGRAVAVGFGAFVLGSSAGGLAVDFWVLHRAGESVHQATRRVLALNTVQWLVLGTFATAAAAVVLAGIGRKTPVGVTIAWLVVVPAAVLAGAWFSRDEQLERFVDPEVREPPKGAKGFGAWVARLWAKLVRLFGDAIGGVGLVRYVVTHPLREPGAIVGFALYWLGDMFTLYAALRAFDVRLDPASLVLAYATGYVIVVLPLPAGAGGAAELAMAGALHLLGVPLGTAILASFAYRFYTVWLPIVPALLFLPAVRGLADDLPRTARAAHAGAERGG